MGVVVPSPSAPIPAERQTAAAATASTSELLELHIRLEWVRRSSGREQTDTDHRTPQPSQPAQQKKVKSQGNKRGWKLGGVAPPLFWGRVVAPPQATNHPPLGASLGALGTGKVWKEAVNNREPSNRPITPVQQQSAATTSKQPSNQQANSGTPSSSSNTLEEPTRPAIATSSLHLFTPCSLLDFHSSN